MSSVSPLPDATTTVDLSDGDSALVVDISDALSERDWVKFTVHTKSTLNKFIRPEFSVIRLHEEFIWLHGTFEENPEYAGYIIPPRPPRPNFDASREKLRQLGDAEGNLTKEEFNKMKQELEAEYLATFKKTVAMHETFLTRLATHPVFRNDPNLAIFLEYEKELSVRGKNKKEMLAGFLSSFHKTSDELLLSNTIKDVDEFFETERQFLVQFHSKLKDCTIKSDHMTSLHKRTADTFIQISAGLIELANQDSKPAESSSSSAQPVASSHVSGAELPPPAAEGSNHLDDKPSTSSSPIGPTEKVEASKSFDQFLTKTSDALEKIRRIEGRVAADQDLKLADLFRYHMRETQSAKDLLFRRLKLLSAYENANKALDKARARNKDVAQAETEQQEACQMFEKISGLAREELKGLKTRRVSSFQKSLIELAELEVKHSKAHAQMLKVTIANLKADL